MLQLATLEQRHYALQDSLYFIKFYMIMISLFRYHHTSYQHSTLQDNITQITLSCLLLRPAPIMLKMIADASQKFSSVQELLSLAAEAKTTNYSLHSDEIQRTAKLFSCLTFVVYDNSLCCTKFNVTFKHTNGIRGN